MGFNLRKNSTLVKSQQSTVNSQQSTPFITDTFGTWDTVSERPYSGSLLSSITLLHEKFLQFDWLRAVVFQLNLEYLHVKITNLLRVVV